MTHKSGLMYLNIAHFFDHFFLLIFPTAVIAIESDWVLTYGEALALGTPMYVAFAFATLPAGWLGDHVSRQKLISGFFLGCGMASVFTGLASGPLGLATGLAFLGVFAAIYHPVGLAMVTELAERRGRALAINGVFGNMGLAAAALVTALLTELFGWRSAFLAPGLMSIVIGCAYVSQSMRRGGSASSINPCGNEHFISSDRATQLRVFAVVLVAALFGGAVFNTITVSLPKLFDERILYSGVNLTQIGGYVALVFAQLPVGNLLDRFGARSILLALLIPQVGVLFLIANTDGVMLIPVAMVLVLLLFAEIPITSWLLGHYVAPQWRARAFSVEYVLSLGMGAAVIPLIAWGHRIGFGFDTQYVVLAVLTGVVLTAALFLPVWNHRDTRSLSKLNADIRNDPEASRT